MSYAVSLAWAAPLLTGDEHKKTDSSGGLVSLRWQGC